LDRPAHDQLFREHAQSLSSVVGRFHNRWAAALANALIRDNTSDVDLSKRTEIGYSLLCSDFIGLGYSYSSSRRWHANPNFDEHVSRLQGAFCLW